MQTKVIDGLSPAELETKLNAWIDTIEGLEVSPAVHLDIVNVQQYTIGEVQPIAGFAQMAGGQPQVRYKFVLLLFYRVRPSALSS